MRSRPQSSRTTCPPLDSRVLQVISRADQLQLRGQRNYGRWKMLTKGFVVADGPERAQWQKTDADESRRDADWNRRHGPVPGGARVLPWRHEHDAVQVEDESRPGRAASAQDH
jgi:hypothetical protein